MFDLNFYSDFWMLKTIESSLMTAPWMLPAKITEASSTYLILKPIFEHQDNLKTEELEG